MLQSASVDVELSQRIHWLIRLRWLASSTVIYGTFLVTGVMGVGLDPLPLYLIGAAIAIYNSLFVITMKWAKVSPTARRLSNSKSMANLQIVTDLFFLTLLIHFSGGVENPFSFYFIFHVIIASILLSPRETLIQATVAIVLFGSLVLGELAQVIPHVHLFGPIEPDLAHDRLFVGSTLLVFGSTLYLAAYMATSIVGRLRMRDREILALTRELELKARELEVAYNRLAELEQIRSQYMRKVSHEIREPLVSIQGSLRALLAGITPEMPDNLQETVLGAERRTAGLLRLMSDLVVLSVAREASSFTQRKAVSASDAARRVTALHAGRAADRGVTISTWINGDTPSILAGPDALDQMLTHLLLNAIQYTPGGGKVEVRVDSVGEAVWIQVADTGIGISSADLPKIFKEFYRAENARRYNEEGTGLGLSIVRSIVETHGGVIDVNSQVGVGTTFTVVLPCGTEPPEESEAERRGEPEETTVVDHPDKKGL